MLGHTYRYAAYNDSGASVDVTLTERKWRIDSNGAIEWSSESTPLSAVSVSDGAQEESSSTDNSTDGYIGAELMLSCSGSGTDGVVTIFLEISTDGGTDWPGDEGGIPIGSIEPGGPDTNLTV